ncbi:MAG TPA: hypothetical protein VD905_06450 [Flavobacteriales bacterium]|nr:hypothetical protein [Flavobacteriales bacterium]
MRLLIFILLFLFLNATAQEDSVLKIHFLYGSKPKRGYKKTECRVFGGLHGGHVTVEIDNVDYGFGPNAKFHVFAHRHNHHGSWGSSVTFGRPLYSNEDKVTTVYIPVTPEQKKEILALLRGYIANPKSPYDYAFFGMRCGAATHDVLGEADILKNRKRHAYAWYSFYPKKLRRRLYRHACSRHWKIETHAGKPSRKWEKDGWRMRSNMKYSCLK